MKALHISTNPSGVALHPLASDSSSALHFPVCQTRITHRENLPKKGSNRIRFGVGQRRAGKVANEILSNFRGDANDADADEDRTPCPSAATHMDRERATSGTLF